jgi:hypothetical protein
MKCISSMSVAFTLALFSAACFAGGVPSSYAPSGHQHHSSHGGHSQKARGSQHKGEHPKNPRTGDHYARHPKSAIFQAP